MRIPFRSFFTTFAGVGLGLSFVQHLAACFGRVLPTSASIAVGVGMFVTWLPVLFVIDFGPSRKGKGIWWNSLHGCPARMRQAMVLFQGYGGTWYLFMRISPLMGTPVSQLTGFRITSAVAMASFATAFAFLYSAAHLANVARECPDGHAIPPGVPFCPQCGRSAIEDVVMGKTP
jgi:hypothetical protein